MKLDEAEVSKEAHRLGRTHAEYAQYGLKPHFLDIYQQKFIGILDKIKIDDLEEKIELLSGFNLLLTYIIECMNFAYAQRIAEIRQAGGRVGGNSGNADDEDLDNISL